MQGQKQTTNGKDAGWPLTPAQEHKYDALAAFDAGQLAEAQHAFDLSVWSDLKNDKGACLICSSQSTQRTTHHNTASSQLTALLRAC